MSTNALKRINLKNKLHEVAVLGQGNAAVSRENHRLNEESATLLEAHLNSKNIVLNFCNENEEDCQMINSFEESNQMIKDQIEVEKRKID